MRHTRLLALAAAGAGILLLFYALGQGPGPRAPESAPSDAGPAEWSESDVLLEPVADEPVARATASRPPAPPVPSASAAEPVVPLEKLLTWSEPRASGGVDLGAGAAADAAAGAGGPGLGDRVYLKRRSDDLSAGSQKRKAETTNVGVRVPVDDAVSLKGGVQIESREDGETRKQERTPTVGVEVKF